MKAYWMKLNTNYEVLVARADSRILLELRTITMYDVPVYVVGEDQFLSKEGARQEAERRAKARVDWELL